MAYQSDFILGKLDGKPAAFLDLESSSGKARLAVDVDVPAILSRYGFNSPIYIRSNGGSNRYPTVKACPPSAEEAILTLGLARVLAVYFEDERFAAKRRTAPLPAKGHIVQYRNGNPFDLRRCNLRCVPAAGARNSYEAARTVRHRAKLLAQGLDPATVYAEQRKGAK